MDDYDAGIHWFFYLLFAATVQLGCVAVYRAFTVNPWVAVALVFIVPLACVSWVMCHEQCAYRRGGG